MTKSVTTTRNGDVAVITIDNPPVNALSFHVREPLMEAFEALRDDASVAAIVLACAGRTFVAGADITEFGKPMQQPDLRALIATLEKIEKPTVAAIHGTALGGGLELALGCHFRVADKAARLGLPEVKLGLLPGAGGTIRLPYLLGPQKALKIIVSGTPIGVAEALDGGLVDAIADGELVAAAIEFARARAAEGKKFPAVRDRRDKVEQADLAAFDKDAAELAKKARGLEAPVACAQSVRNAITLTFDEALAKEREYFVKLVSGDQSRAQRHLFFAEREAAKVPGVGKDVAPREIRRAGVIGAGTMGGGIAMSFVNGGIPVTLLEMNSEALDRGLATIEKNYAISVSRGSLSEEAKARRMALFTRSTDYADLADCDIVIEAVFEEMAVKKEVFGKLDKVAKPGAILATNTSYLDVDEIATSTGRPQDVVGTHFFSPANVMKLLEIVRGKKTAPDVLATLLSLAKKIGKVPVVVGVCHGFVGNRMLASRSEESESLLLEGATPSQVDKVFADFGWPMGPFQMYDLAGLDIGWRNRKSLGKTAIIADPLCEQGRFGQKTGKGFYLYENGSRTPTPDPEVEKLIDDKARERGINRRTISAEEIAERTLYPMINEGAKILEEGIAARASDVDIVWTNGYGFPIGKGGPMFFAELEGIGKIVERLEYWHGRTGKDIFKPSALLKKLAASGGSFSDPKEAAA
ncbi:3-hydroxyacyl-CoA dehydrogenase NAD-binding domain-containing protein [Mesorhizobium sp. ZC-5]|uniref:3-hydroxyacyl-CoA dehydrogenase NAD-binding domain-containing protein n=1 Tax=Mesorhizobium sp. ZC-5 TaxID=2986066 RepID=UPI0021E88130|nr:3-hydroxyacyl-CoA dehydrogenase NAD-binding domain-containing protein [Mesorhizobium sp. ZC-5]MCV3242323.1 3-hydroxyacyl-CoA dehydrogenase NAD-binding domain-containing protein [Mesorhizobium sp. ZC-5]